MAYGASGKRREWKRNLRFNWTLYLLALPAILYILVFCYAPMYGLQIAFRDYSFAGGFTGSPFAGMKWVNMFLSSPKFGLVMRNTLVLSLYSLAAGFPVPILLALMLNCMTSLRLKRAVQTITYMPHFISVIVLVGMMSAFLSPTSGFVNTIITALGGKARYFFGEAGLFRPLYVWSGVWQEAGWGAIIYIAALTQASPELHEAATIDGASRLKRVWHIDIPCILPAMVILLILRCGSILNLSFDKTFAMQNALNINVSEVLSTYNYKVGIKEMRYSYSSAIGLFGNVVNFVLLTVVNFTSRRLSGTSLW